MDAEAVVEPVTVFRHEVPVESGDFFDAAPVLAVSDGPWAYSRRPRLGAALKIGALAAGALAIGVIVFDQVREDTLLEGDLVVSGGAFAFLLVVLIGTPGIRFSRGKIRHRPSGRTFGKHREEYPGITTAGSAVHAGLTRGDLTDRKILAIVTQGRSEGRLVVSVYWSDRADVSIATVHLEHTDGKFTIWPPVSIPPDQVGRLMSSEPNTFDVSAATQ